MGLLTPRTGPFHRIGDRYKTMFDGNHFLGQNALEESWMAVPPANVKKEGTKVILELAMPGFTKNDIKVELIGNDLHISAHKEAENDESYIRKEVPSSIENQVIRLSESVDQEMIHVSLENGLLRITLPEADKKKTNNKLIKVT